MYDVAVLYSTGLYDVIVQLYRYYSYEYCTTIDSSTSTSDSAELGAYRYEYSYLREFLSGFSYRKALQLHVGTVLVGIPMEPSTTSS